MILKNWSKSSEGSGESKVGVGENVDCSRIEAFLRLPSLPNREKRRQSPREWLHRRISTSTSSHLEWNQACSFSSTKLAHTPRRYMCCISLSKGVSGSLDNPGSCLRRKVTPEISRLLAEACYDIRMHINNGTIEGQSDGLSKFCRQKSTELWKSKAIFWPSRVNFSERQLPCLQEELTEDHASSGIKGLLIYMVLTSRDSNLLTLINRSTRSTQPFWDWPLRILIIACHGWPKAVR